MKKKNDKEKKRKTVSVKKTNSAWQMTIEVESLCHYQRHHCLNKIIRAVITIVMVYRHLFLTCGFTNLSRICSTPHFVTFTFKHCLHGIVLTIKDQFNFTNPLSPRSLDFSTLTFLPVRSSLFFFLWFLFQTLVRFHSSFIIAISSSISPSLCAIATIHDP